MDYLIGNFEAWYHVKIKIVDKKLVGILTNRDIRFLKGGVQKVREVMTKEVITGNGNLTVEQALSIMNQKKIEKLPHVCLRIYGVEVPYD